jgi:hypothetical protein
MVSTIFTVDDNMATSTKYSANPLYLIQQTSMLFVLNFFGPHSLPLPPRYSGLLLHCASGRENWAENPVKLGRSRMGIFPTKRAPSFEAKSILVPYPLCLQFCTMALLNGLQPYPLNYNPLLLQVEVYRRPQLDQLLFQDDYIIYMVLVSVRALDEQCDFLEFGG